MSCEWCGTQGGRYCSAEHRKLGQDYPTLVNRKARFPTTTSSANRAERKAPRSGETSTFLQQSPAHPAEG